MERAAIAPYFAAARAVLNATGFKSTSAALVSAQSYCNVIARLKGGAEEPGEVTKVGRGDVVRMPQER